MQKGLQQGNRRCVLVRGAEQFKHQNGVLRDRKGIIANGLAVPPSDARKPVGDVGKFDIDGGGVENV